MKTKLLSEAGVLFPKYWDLEKVLSAFAKLSTLELYDYFSCPNATSFTRLMKPIFPNRPERMPYSKYLKSILESVGEKDSESVLESESESESVGEKDSESVLESESESVLESESESVLPTHNTYEKELHEKFKFMAENGLNRIRLLKTLTDTEKGRWEIYQANVAEYGPD